MSSPKKHGEKNRDGIFPAFDYRVPMPTGRSATPSANAPPPPSRPATKDQTKGETLSRRLRWK